MESELLSKERLNFIIQVLAIVVLLLFVWMMFVKWKYQAQFLQAPCELCASLNPILEPCFKTETMILKDAQGNIIATGKEAEGQLKERNANLSYPEVNLSLFNGFAGQ